MSDNQEWWVVLSASINNLAEAIHRHADLQMGEPEEDDGPMDRDVDIAGRPVKIKAR